MTGPFALPNTKEETGVALQASRPSFANAQNVVIIGGGGVGLDKSLAAKYLKLL